MLRVTNALGETLHFIPYFAYDPKTGRRFLARQRRRRRGAGVDSAKEEGGGDDDDKDDSDGDGNNSGGGERAGLIPEPFEIGPGRAVVYGRAQPPTLAGLAVAALEADLLAQLIHKESIERALKAAAVLGEPTAKSRRAPKPGFAVVEEMKFVRRLLRRLNFRSTERDQALPVLRNALRPHNASGNFDGEGSGDCETSSGSDGDGDCGGGESLDGRDGADYPMDDGPAQATQTESGDAEAEAGGEHGSDSTAAEESGSEELEPLDLSIAEGALEALKKISASLEAVLPDLVEGYSVLREAQNHFQKVHLGSSAERMRLKRFISRFDEVRKNTKKLRDGLTHRVTDTGFQSSLGARIKTLMTIMARAQDGTERSGSEEESSEGGSRGADGAGGDDDNDDGGGGGDGEQCDLGEPMYVAHGDGAREAEVRDMVGAVRQLAAPGSRMLDLESISPQACSALDSFVSNKSGEIDYVPYNGPPVSGPDAALITAPRRSRRNVAGSAPARDAVTYDARGVELKLFRKKSEGFRLRVAQVKLWNLASYSKIGCCVGKAKFEFSTTVLACEVNEDATAAGSSARNFLLELNFYPKRESCRFALFAVVGRSLRRVTESCSFKLSTDHATGQILDLQQLHIAKWVLREHARAGKKGRGFGLAALSALVAHISICSPDSQGVVVKTPTPEGAQFYSSVGFQKAPTDGEYICAWNATHPKEGLVDEGGESDDPGDLSGSSSRGEAGTFTTLIVPCLAEGGYEASKFAREFLQVSPQQGAFRSICPFMLYVNPISRYFCIFRSRMFLLRSGSPHASVRRASTTCFFPPLAQTSFQWPRSIVEKLFCFQVARGKVSLL